MKIIYRPHLKRRIKEREITKRYPKNIYLRSELKLFDTKTGHCIAVARMKYAGEVRKLAVSYDIIEENIEIITIFPISDRELDNKIKSGRWIIET